MNIVRIKIRFDDGVALPFPVSDVIRFDINTRGVTIFYCGTDREGLVSEEDIQEVQRYHGPVPLVRKITPEGSNLFKWLRKAA